jgi:hypothetical protein
LARTDPTGVSSKVLGLKLRASLAVNGPTEINEVTHEYEFTS